LNQPGEYYVEFVAQTAAVTALGGFQLQLNGTNVGPTQTLLTLGAPIVLQTVVTVTTAPSTLQVVATGLGVTLATGNSANIFIERLR
jgi:hypothetical protein